MGHWDNYKFIGQLEILLWNTLVGRNTLSQLTKRASSYIIKSNQLALVNSAEYCSASKPHTSQPKFKLSSASTSLPNISSDLYGQVILKAQAKPENTSIHLKKQRKNIFELFNSPADQRKKSFTFNTAASGMPKKQMKRTASDIANFLSIQCGEDAFFLRHDAIGVADGVGGWNEVPGADPSLYSRKLMHYASLEIEKIEDTDFNILSDDGYSDIQPQKVIRNSYDKLSLDCKREGILGSCTALVAILRDEELRVANLGDCGLMVIRKNETIFRTEEQQHSFNFPYQLGVGSSDAPEDAFACTIIVQEGDVVIIGTDGLFDNVFDEDILAIVSRLKNNQSPSKIDPKAITDALLAKAREIGESRHAESPFSTKALQKGFFYQGGKMDDMTVLAVQFTNRLSEDSPDRR